ncbi:hypothetical protein JL722_10229 [Aureococcus anophagefferens]|nr:hypothetical protein JL722_10229 [Aureococcus anophagefferens]
MAISYAEFHWRSAPLSHGPTVTLAALWYVLLALLAKRACDQRTPPKHTSASYVLAAHSAVLAVASLVMCAGALREAFARSALEGSWSWFFCENRRAAPKLYFWAYAYYLSKYYELLDTFLPVLVHGRVPRHFGMHVFHHACVLFMSWGYLEFRQTLAFGGLIANTAVHVLMYIIQFVSSFLLCVVFASGAHGEPSTCSGLGALAGNAAFNAVLLYLFFGVLASSKKKKAG